jgi:outer membrane biosynthesis protein TonB
MVGKSKSRAKDVLLVARRRTKDTVPLGRQTHGQLAQWNAQSLSKQKHEQFAILYRGKQHIRRHCHVFDCMQSPNPEAEPEPKPEPQSQPEPKPEPKPELHRQLRR